MLGPKDLNVPRDGALVLLVVRRQVHPRVLVFEPGRRWEAHFSETGPPDGAPLPAGRPSLVAAASRPSSTAYDGDAASEQTHVTGRSRIHCVSAPLHSTFQMSPVSVSPSVPKQLICEAGRQRRAEPSQLVRAVAPAGARGAHGQVGSSLASWLPDSGEANRWLCSHRRVSECCSLIISPFLMGVPCAQ